MNQGGDDFAAHPLSEREAAGGMSHQIANLKHIDQFGKAAFELDFFKIIHFAEKGKTVLHRKIVPQLGALSEHGADMV